jgi:hypothetical protein
MLLGAVIIFKPKTPVRGRRSGSRIYWRWNREVVSADRRSRPRAAIWCVPARKAAPAESMIRATVTLKHLAAALLAHLAPLLNERRASTPCFKITTAAIGAKMQLNGEGT